MVTSQIMPSMTREKVKVKLQLENVKRKRKISAKKENKEPNNVFKIYTKPKSAVVHGDSVRNNFETVLYKKSINSDLCNYKVSEYTFYKT